MALQKIGLKPMMAYPNIWIRMAIRPVGYEYYEMILVYVDDIMILSHLDDDIAKKRENFTQSKKGVKVRLSGT